MKALIQRAYIEQKDHERLDDLFLAYRAATRVDMYPTIWRLYVLLSSRVWEPAYDTQIWEDPTGDLAACALLWRRRVDDRYMVLDQFIHPHDATATLADAILRWAMRRVQVLAEQRESPITLLVTELDPAFQIDNHLPAYGFILTQPDLDIYN